ncbi:Membrane protein involved in the export of O-antigen and teichoic acid [Pseudonocardia thermophila]|jgi:Membrane protein involved in the export of O-antigen and teichoic acid|uniref:Membrane protein involved in the export of O-antigen and teichoic acid n=1 Tax=Pseudonocardia thermophila TaxID=1848 RepID=A0A1M6YUL5_PSETH|nr:oligosaccharide flippase family protein [Pseudonocardia thermophila]SHL21729.1 Membrane protein involved in the export of O-antigen and teichoic acid [Pseudonocardia thermophila]
MSAGVLGKARGLLAGAQDDPMIRNAFYLMLTTVTTAAMGFVFWLITARLYDVDDVGRATSLTSAVTLLSYFSLIGLGYSLVRYLPTSRAPGDYVSSALIAVTAAGVVGSVLLLAVIPVVSPEMSFVNRSWETMATFVVLATTSALKLLTDSVFVACREARWNFLINGLLMGVVKIALPVLFIPYGAMGIFVAQGLASVVGAVASIAAIRWKLGVPLRLRFRARLLRETLPYSMGNYVTSGLNLVPLMVIPVVVLEGDGPAAAAGYFIAFQIATVINSISFAVGESLFAEGSHEDRSLGALMRRSAAVMLVATVPVVAVVVLLARFVLTIFGPEYVDTATGTLIVLALGAFPVAFHTWTSFLIKITRQLRAMVAAELVFAVVTTILAALAAGRGTVWVAVAWGVGNAVSGIVAAVALRRRPAQVAAEPVGSAS